jgi:hypothetical protein
MKELSIQEYGESDARTLKALKKLMIFLSKREEFQEALENLDQIEKIELANYGLKSNQIAKTYSMKATLLHKIGEKKKAKAIYKYI